MKKRKKRTSAAWTKREEAVICRLRRRGWDTDRIAKKLPNRTVVAVERRVLRLLAQGRIERFRVPWSDEENALLCALRAKGLPPSGMVVHFKNRTRDAIANQLRQLQRAGIIDADRAPLPRRPQWTDEEESVLDEMRTHGATLGEIAANLPRRSRGAVAVKAHTLIDADELPRSAYSPLSKRSWSTEEDELVAVMRKAGKSAKAMAAALNRPVASVNSRIAERVRKGELGLIRPSRESRTRREQQQ